MRAVSRKAWGVAGVGGASQVHPLSKAIAILLIGFVILADSASARGAPDGSPRDSALVRLLDQVMFESAAGRWAAVDSLTVLAIQRATALARVDSAGLATALAFRANSRYNQVQFRDTLVLTSLARSTAIQKRLHEPDTLFWVKTLELQGRAFISGDRPEDALRALSDAMVLCSPTLADRDSLRAALWLTSARAQRRMSRSLAALSALDSARTLRMARFGPDHVSLAEVLIEQGTVYGRSNRYAEGEACLQRAIAILEGQRATSHPSFISALTELGNIQFRTGDIARSIETIERATAVVIEESGPASPRLIPPMHNMGLRLFEFGDYAGAYAIFDANVTRAEASFGAGNSRTENTRYMAGASAMSMGDTAAAARHIRRSLAELGSRPLDANHLALSVERYHSMLLQARGDLLGAERVVTQALARERAAPSIVPDVLFQLLERRIAVQALRNDTLGVDQSLNELAREFGDSTRVEGVIFMDAKHVRARKDAWRGRHTLAWSLALQTEADARERMTRNARALPDARALQLAGELSDPLQLLLSLAAPRDAAELEVAWDRLIRWRGSVTAELARRRLSGTALEDTALASAHAHWVRTMRRTAQLEVTGSAADSQTATARAEAQLAERRYRAMATSRGITEDSTRADLASVRARLGATDALISIVTLGGTSDTARVIAFATQGPNGPVLRLDLGRRATLDAAIAAWRGTLQQPPARNQEAAAEKQCRRLGEAVRARVWDPLTKALPEATRLIVVADGAMAELPWQALPSASGRYQAESGPKFETLAAEREWLAPTRTSLPSLLAIGDPDFDARSGHPHDAIEPTGPTESARGLRADCRGVPTVALSALPGARAEVEDIVRAWNAEHATSPARLLTGAAGTEEAFRTRAPRSSILHLATHGIVWGDTCAPVVARSRGVGGVSPVDASASATRRSRRPAAVAGDSKESPRLRPTPWSGRRVWLALAGANHARTGAIDADDGLLTADEVVTLDLSGVDWVVLSACQSGAGEQWPLEGSIGMQRAFRLAGAGAVIASQWPIADGSTREWMLALYRARAAGSVYANDAIRQASREILQARRAQHRTTHPFYWAAFTSNGR